ncbi:MAG: RluA family pseudouridine synthase [Deltaproteobacteria bacterium]|nr:RluA family pseudouridine synthase [Deltaproteobacteria bacterium]
MADTRNLRADFDDAQKRLDVFLAEKLTNVTRSAIKKIILHGLATINGRIAKAGRRLKTGDSIEVTLPPASVSAVIPEPIPLEILYEDEDIIVVNKSAGLAVHPGAGRSSGTLVNALLHHTKNLSVIGSPLRPGIVHRLDKDTTGVLVVAKNDLSHLNLAAQFKDHTTTRKYLALVKGLVRSDSGEISKPIGRDVKSRVKMSTKARRTRPSLTAYKVVKRFPGFTLLELKLSTGRTHQVRVHLSSINHPVVGDAVYGGKIPPVSTRPKPLQAALKKIRRQLLHAALLGIVHPRTGVYMEWSARMPDDMREVISALEGAKN